MAQPPVDRDFLALQEALAGRYSLERELGRGGMGIVYLAREVALDRLVAIKLLPPALASRPVLRERFLREARTAARLSHPNVIPIYAVDEVGDFVFFAMAYVEGETLGQRVRARGPLPPSEAARVVRETAWALAYAHAQGVIHRDVKPDNILLETSGRVLIGDFGIARVTEHSGSTASGEIIGTAEFMSPEQANGASLDARSDLYSLGVVGFYAISGRLPFEAATAAALLAQHVTKPAPPVASVAPTAPRRLAGAIDRCLAKNPAQRFPSGEALGEEVAATLETRKDLPVAVRVFLKRAVDTEPNAARILVGVIIGFTGVMLILGGGETQPMLSAGGVALLVALIGTPVFGLARRVWQLLKGGNRLDDLSYALRTELQRRREELAFEYGREASMIERIARYGALALGGAALLSGAIVLLGPSALGETAEGCSPSRRSAASLAQWSPSAATSGGPVSCGGCGLASGTPPSDAGSSAWPAWG